MRGRMIKQWGWGILCLVLVLPLMLTACGKKGDPVPPEEPVVVR